MSSGSEEEIDNIDASVGHSLLAVDERTEAVTKAWLDNGERRPMKRLRIINEQNTPNSTPRHGLFPSTSVTNEIAFCTQGPRAFSAQAKKEIKNAFIYAIAPPPASELLSSLESRGLPSKIYQDPHYSRAEDVPERPWEFAGLVYRLRKGDTCERRIRRRQERVPGPIRQDWCRWLGVRERAAKRERSTQVAYVYHRGASLRETTSSVSGKRRWLFCIRRFH